MIRGLGRMSLPGVAALLGYVIFLIGLGVRRLLKYWGLLVIVAVVGLSGCHSRLLGDSPHHDQDIENLNGVWVGRLDVQGVNTFVHFILIQKGDQITWGNDPSDAPYFAINYGQYGDTKVTGTVSGHGFTMTGHDGSLCPNPWTFSGEVNNGIMLVTIQTQGNNVPGTYCYSQPLNQTIQMTH